MATDLFGAALALIIVLAIIFIVVAKVQGDRAIIYAYDKDQQGTQMFKRLYDGDKKYVREVLRGDF